MIQNGEKYLVTVDDWFIAPDGEQYKSVWGTCRIKTIEEVFGFTPSRPSTNWYMEIGNEDCPCVVAGCRIHYAIACPKRPCNDFVTAKYIEKEQGLTYSANRIYFAENKMRTKKEVKIND
jgi:hypothetical protein